MCMAMKSWRFKIKGEVKKHCAKTAVCETNEYFQIVKQNQTGTNLHLDYILLPF